MVAMSVFWSVILSEGCFVWCYRNFLFTLSVNEQYQIFYDCSNKQELCNTPQPYEVDKTPFFSFFVKTLLDFCFFLCTLWKVPVMIQSLYRHCSRSNQTSPCSDSAGFFCKQLSFLCLSYYICFDTVKHFWVKLWVKCTPCNFTTI